MRDKKNRGRYKTHIFTAFVRIIRGGCKSVKRGRYERGKGVLTIVHFCTEISKGIYNTIRMEMKKKSETCPTMYFSFLQRAFIVHVTSVVDVVLFFFFYFYFRLLQFFATYLGVARVWKNNTSANS